MTPPELSPELVGNGASVELCDTPEEYKSDVDVE